ncbi:molybdopterin molybdotransferase, partial [Candidatus Hakubella thermalkaliphila]
MSLSPLTAGAEAVTPVTVVEMRN